MAHPKSFVRATGIINGDWQLNIKSDAGESRGIIIDGGTKYINPGLLILLTMLVI